MLESTLIYRIGWCLYILKHLPMIRRSGNQNHFPYYSYLGIGIIGIWTDFSASSVCMTLSHLCVRSLLLTLPHLSGSLSP